MYSKAIDWVKRIDIYEKAILDSQGKITKSIVIEPEFLFTHNTIGIYTDSTTAKDYWQRAGSFYQAFSIPFGNGYAEAENFLLRLKRYQIFRFTRFPDIGNTQYRISFSAQTYLEDIRLEIWEYNGAAQGATLDSLATLSNKQIAALSKIQSSLNKLLKK